MILLHILLTAQRQLTVEDLSEVLRALHGVKENWFSIGLALNIRPSILQAIEADERTDEHRFAKMLLRWLQNSEDRSWKVLVSALKVHYVRRSDVAKAVEDKYIYGRNTDHYSAG